MIRNCRCWKIVGLLLVGALMLSACAEELKPNNEDVQDIFSDSDNILHSQDGSLTTTVINATDEEAWILLDLDSGDEVEDATSWDLGFKRFQIQANNGISGSGDVLVAVVEGVSFDALQKAPEDGYLIDATDGADDDADPDLAFLVDGAWYSYNPAEHTLGVRDRIYVVRTGEKAYFKVQLLSYYDDVGSAGYVNFKWEAVQAPDVEPKVDVSPNNAPNNVNNSAPNNVNNNTPEPDPEGSLIVEAGATGQWVFVDLDGGVLSDESEAVWDVAMSRSQVQTNGGTTGEGLSGVQLADGDFDAIVSATTLGYAVDEMVPIPGRPGAGEYSGNPVLNEWYDYNPANHQLTPKDQAYLVRTSEGAYVKMKIHAYADGRYTLLVEPVTVDVEEVDSTIATTSEAWTFWNLRSGEEVLAEEAEGSNWDVALSRTQLQTNSGTSGDGDGGALLTDATSLEELMEVPAGDFAVDEMLPIPGPPGSGEYSGNAVLGDWYDYDGATHVVSSKGQVYVIRTADGHFAKLLVSQYDDGTYDIVWAYAGAGRTSFTP